MAVQVTASQLYHYTVYTKPMPPIMSGVSAYGDIQMRLEMA